MKTLRLLVLIFASALLLKTFAYDVKVDGIYYDVNLDEMTATVTDCGIKNYGSYTGDIVVPEFISINGRTIKVSYIGNNAFSMSGTLTSVILPNTIKSIGEYAFYGCTKMKELHIPREVTNLYNSTFANSGLEKIIIPENVIFIEYLAFSGCKNLKKVTIEDSDITLSLKDYFPYVEQFYWNRPLKEPNFNKNLLGCIDYESLKELTIGDKILSCKECSLTNCRLEKVTVYSTSPEYLRINFSNYTYVNAILYVPKGTKNKYMAADKWKNFFNIQETDLPTNIDNVYEIKDVVEVARYSIDGKRLSAPQKGINIVEMSDGSRKKVLVK